jgi:hypothetical protein
MLRVIHCFELKILHEAARLMYINTNADWITPIEETVSQ